jgi:hypothetical protein|tara:strand:- start:241 stop:600 length:360 start_codon:yes stop_codon:yes gene_type:complete
MAGSTATKRANAQLDKSYKRATGEIDDRKGAKVKPGDIVTAVFLLIAAKSFNDQCEATHGISPYKSAKKAIGDGVWAIRNALSRLIGGKGGGGGRGRGDNRTTAGRKQFKGKGRKVGKK